MNPYRNKKSGHLYKILFEAVDVTNNKMINVYIYKRLDGTGPMVVRSQEEFHKKFTQE